MHRNFNQTPKCDGPPDGIEWALGCMSSSKKTVLFNLKSTARGVQNLKKNDSWLCAYYSNGRHSEAFFTEWDQFSKQQMSSFSLLKNKREREREASSRMSDKNVVCNRKRQIIHNAKYISLRQKYNGSAYLSSLTIHRCRYSNRRVHVHTIQSCQRKQRNERRK